MAADLRANCAAILAELTKIEARAPLVVDAYRKRLHERIQAALAEYQVTLDPSDLIKDVAIFSDRGDISEEKRAAPQSPGTVLKRLCGGRKAPGVS